MLAMKSGWSPVPGGLRLTTARSSLGLAAGRAALSIKARAALMSGKRGDGMKPTGPAARLCCHDAASAMPTIGPADAANMLEYAVLPGLVVTLKEKSAA